jgi:hypothetical protein
LAAEPGWLGVLWRDSTLFPVAVEDGTGWIEAGPGRLGWHADTSHDEKRGGAPRRDDREVPERWFVESFDGLRSEFRTAGLTTYVACGSWNAVATTATKMPDRENPSPEDPFPDAGIAWSDSVRVSTFASVPEGSPGAGAVREVISRPFDRLERNAVAARPEGPAPGGNGQAKVDLRAAASHLAETKARVLRSRRSLLGRTLWYVEAVRTYGGNGPVWMGGLFHSVYRAWITECVADETSEPPLADAPSGPLTIVDEVCSLETYPWHLEYPHRPYALVVSGDDLLVLVEEIELDSSSYRLKRIGSGSTRTLVKKEIGGC